MTAAQFTKWVAEMKEKQSVNKTECASLLGCGRNQVTTWQKTGAPHYIALACAALVIRLEPYR